MIQPADTEPEASPDLLSADLTSPSCNSKRRVLESPTCTLEAIPRQRRYKYKKRRTSQDVKVPAPGAYADTGTRETA
jgi:hypothetical protein